MHDETGCGCTVHTRGGAAEVCAELQHAVSGVHSEGEFTVDGNVCIPPTILKFPFSTTILKQF